MGRLVRLRGLGGAWGNGRERERERGREREREREGRDTETQKDRKRDAPIPQLTPSPRPAPASNAAGTLTHKESGFIAEIAQELALRSGQNVWIDGSLQDHAWWSGVFADIRKRFPRYRLAIFYVYASEAEVLRRAEKRGRETGGFGVVGGERERKGEQRRKRQRETDRQGEKGREMSQRESREQRNQTSSPHPTSGRFIPEDVLKSSMEKCKTSVKVLSPLADFLAVINNEKRTPQLDLFEDRSRSFTAIYERFVSPVTRHGGRRGSTAAIAEGGESGESSRGEFESCSFS